MAGVRAIVNAFEYAFDGLHSPYIQKTYRFHEWTERDLNSPLRFFLMGYFGHKHLRCEIPVRSGRIDFAIGKTAVEYAVASSGTGAGLLGAGVNKKELTKLGEYDGPGLLVLLDFNDEACFNRQTFKARYRAKWAEQPGATSVNVAAVGWCDGKVTSSYFQLRT